MMGIWGIMMTEREYWFWLCTIDGVGMVTMNILLEYFKSPENIFNTKEKSFEHIKFGGKRARESFLRSRNEQQIRTAYERMETKGIHFTYKDAGDFPWRLKALSDCPKGLFYRGHLPSEDKDKKVIAIIGARECTDYGKEAARYFARELSNAGIEIISGLARGVDGYAHRGAIEADGATYGILGCGPDICYPQENIELFMEMQRKGGVLSEFPIGTPPRAGLFPIRNRIISGLSDGILVIEAKDRSGSLITVDAGLTQGRDIFALPGRMTDKNSAGCNQLIKLGAKPVTTPEDILEEYHITVPKIVKNKLLLDNSEKLVYANLCLSPKSLDMIASETGLSSAKLMNILTCLEIKGIIKQSAKNQYSIYM